MTRSFRRRREAVTVDARRRARRVRSGRTVGKKRRGCSAATNRVRERICVYMDYARPRGLGLGFLLGCYGFSHRIPEHIVCRKVYPETHDCQAAPGRGRLWNCSGRGVPRVPCKVGTGTRTGKVVAPSLACGVPRTCGREMSSEEVVRERK